MRLAALEDRQEDRQPDRSRAPVVVDNAQETMLEEQLDLLRELKADMDRLRLAVYHLAAAMRRGERSAE